MGCAAVELNHVERSILIAQSISHRVLFLNLYSNRAYAIA